jgi:hypothetical protein
LKKTLEGLKRNNVPLIYAFCDGPKDNTIADKVTEVRNILISVKWTRVIITVREENLGLGTSVRAGVTYVLDSHDKVIVIEDDIVMRPGAYEYTCKALNFFEDNDRIMSISMWVHPILVPKKAEKGFYSERFMCWGWGTYKKYWTHYNQKPLEIFHQTISQQPQLLKWGNDIKIQAYNAEKYNVWYIGYALLHFLLSKLSYFPAESLVVNIGMDETATHTKSNFVPEDLSIIDKNVQVPDFNTIDEIYACPSNFRRYFDHKNKSGMMRIMKKILNKWLKVRRAFYV